MPKQNPFATVNLPDPATSSIPEPYENVASLRATCMALKEAVETLTKQRGAIHDAAPTWGELQQLGIVRPEQVNRIGKI